MKLIYFFGQYEEQEFEYEADDDEVMSIIFDAIKADGYDITEEMIDEYTVLCNDEIKDHFCSEAYEQWKEYEEYRKDQLGYYGFSIKDFI
jgi:hypothetical protein